MAHILFGCNGVYRLLQVGRFSQFSKKQGHQVTVLMDSGCYRVYPTFDTTGTLTESCPLGCHEGTLS